VFGDFQSLKPNPDEHRIQPIEASHLDTADTAGRRVQRIRFFSLLQTTSLRAPAARAAHHAFPCLPHSADPG
jgi:hypothetical protein